MGWQFVLSGLSSILVIFCLFYLRFKKKADNEKTFSKKILFLIIPQIFFFLFSVAWLLEFQIYDNFEFSLIYTAGIIFQTIFLFIFFKDLLTKSHTFCFLLFYSVGIISMVVSYRLTPFTMIVISFLLNMFIVLSVGPKPFRLNYFEKAGIAYSGFSFLFEFLNLYNQNFRLYTFILSNTLLVLFIHSFSHLLKESQINEKPRLYKETPKIVLFIKYFIYYIIMANFVLISTVAVHEFSHVATARFYGCDSRSIIYESGRYPYSEIICDNLNGKNAIALAGPLVPIFIGIILFFIGGVLIKPLALLSLGFNLLASYMDLKDVGVSGNIIFGSIILGLILLILGLYNLAKSRLSLYEKTNII